MYKIVIFIIVSSLTACASLNPQQREFNKVRGALAEYPSISVNLIEKKGIFVNIKEKDLCNDNRREISKGLRELYKLYGYSYDFKYDYSEINSESASIYKELNKNFISGKKGGRLINKLCLNDVDINSNKKIYIIIPPNNKKFYEM